MIYNQLFPNVLLFSCNLIGQLCLGGPSNSSCTVNHSGEWLKKIQFKLADADEWFWVDTRPIHVKIYNLILHAVILCCLTQTVCD